MKKPILIFLAIVLIALILKFIFSTSPVNSGVDISQADLIFFWGEGCPHCQIVEKYITDNNIESKLKIAYKEVYNDIGNQQLLADTVKNCPEIDTSNGVGVPLGFVTKSGICLYGDQPIIDWLSPMLK